MTKRLLAIYETSIESHRDELSLRIRVHPKGATVDAADLERAIAAHAKLTGLDGHLTAIEYNKERGDASAVFCTNNDGYSVRLLCDNFSRAAAAAAAESDLMSTCAFSCGEWRLHEYSWLQIEPEDGETEKDVEADIIFMNNSSFDAPLLIPGEVLAASSSDSKFEGSLTIESATIKVHPADSAPDVTDGECSGIVYRIRGTARRITGPLAS